jgi:hypothetical protein
VTEVRTSRGWLLVDSNEPFLALDRLGRPHAARQLPWVPDTLLPRPPAFQLPYWAIPGLYSRKGTLFWPYIRYIPNVHWGDLWGGLLGGA